MKMPPRYSTKKHGILSCSSDSPPVSFDSEFPQAPYSLVLFIKVVKGKLSWVVLYHSMAYCKLQRKVNFLNQRPKSATLYFLYHFSVQDKPDGLPLISIYRQYHH